MNILDIIRELLSEVLKLLKAINSRPDKSRLTGDIKIMYVVKADNPDVGFAIQVGEVVDSEGNVIPDAALTVEVVSDNDAVVDVTPDETGKAGMVHFGSPGIGNINATVKDAQGDLLGSFGAQFTVTVGDPAAMVGGGISFDGLVEVVEPEA